MTNYFSLGCCSISSGMMHLDCSLQETGYDSIKSTLPVLDQVMPLLSSACNQIYTRSDKLMKL